MTTRDDDQTTAVARRRFGRTLLALPALGVAAAATQPGEAHAASAGDSWKMEGNSNVDDNDFLGTTNNKALRFKTNNAERMRIGSDGNVSIGTTTVGAKLTITPRCITSPRSRARASSATPH